MNVDRTTTKTRPNPADGDPRREEQEGTATLAWLDSEAAKDGDGEAWRYADAARLIRMLRGIQRNVPSDPDQRAEMVCHVGPVDPAEQAAFQAYVERWTGATWAGMVQGQMTGLSLAWDCWCEGREGRP
jgi:hypothetical protein